MSQLFGYRSHVMSFPKRGGGLIFPGWTRTVTMGSISTKSDHTSYGFDTNVLHSSNSIGSISNNNLTGYEYWNAEGDGQQYDDTNATVTRVIWHEVVGNASLTGVRFRFRNSDFSVANQISCGADYGSNLCGLTLTIGSTGFDFGDESFNKSCGPAGGNQDAFWQASSNPFGTTTNGATVTVSINAGTNPSPGAP